MRGVWLAVGFLAGMLIVGCSTKPAGGPGGPGGKDTGPPLVTAAPVRVQTVTQFTEVTGTMKARERVEVRPQVSGYIQEVHFKDGADVKQGDLLVTIDPVLYAADREKARGDVQTAEAQAKVAAADAARITGLRKSGAASQEEADRAVALKAVGDASIVSARAVFDRAEQNVKYTQVRSPIDGRVDRILVTKGNLVAGGTMQPTVLTVITAIDPIFAYFDLDEQTVLYYRTLIEQGKFTSVRDRRIPVELQLKGEEGYPHKGELDFTATELNPTTGSLQLRAVVPNPLPYKFAPGMFAKARLPGAKVEDAILIPDSAVATDQNRKIVYVVVAKDGKEVASVREVKVGPLSDGLRVIAEGLNPGDRVILRGIQRVQEGTPVEVQPGEIKPTPGL